MIKSITVTNFRGESLKMELRNPEKSGFLIKEITGLGPCKADINSKTLATNDGSIYNSSRANSRNIVIKLVYLFNPTIEDMRQKSYRYFPVKEKITIRIETDNRVCETVGYVESNEPDIFSKEESASISIICPDPYFYSAGEDGTTVTMFYGVENNFEFPFSNESVTTDLIEIGIATYSMERLIYYSGDAKIGVDITIYANGEVKNPSIYNVRTKEYIKIDTDRLEMATGKGLIQGDKVMLSTVKGNRYCTLFRDGNEINIINCVDRKSTWLMLNRGDNIIAYLADNGGSNLELKIENRTIFEGV